MRALLLALALVVPELVLGQVGTRPRTVTNVCDATGSAGGTATCPSVSTSQCNRVLTVCQIGAGTSTGGTGFCQPVIGGVVSMLVTRWTFTGTATGAAVLMGPGGGSTVPAGGSVFELGALIIAPSSLSCQCSCAGGGTSVPRMQVWCEKDARP
jgi:hypothetical protein